MALGRRTAAARALARTVAITVMLRAAGSTGRPAFVVLEVLGGVLVGLVPVYLAHALVPDPPGTAAPRRRGTEPAGPPPLPRTAHAAAAAVMLALHPWVAAAGTRAVVLLLNVATMPRQPDLAGSARHRRCLLAGNLIGGLPDVAAALPVALRSGPGMLAAAVAAGAMAMACLLAHLPGRVPVLLPGFVTCTLPCGLAVSSVAPTGDVALWQRLVLIAAAAGCARAAIALAAPLAARRTVTIP